MGLFEILRGKNKVRGEYMRDGGFVTRWARPPSRNTSEWLGTFSTSPRLAVVDRIASDIANVNGKLLRVNPDGSETEVTEHPFLDFMLEPNPLYEMTSAAIWRLHEIYLMLVGESFVLVERDDHGRPFEMWPVPPHWVQMTPHLGYPYYRIVSTTGIYMEVSVDDMFVMKQLNPLDPFMRGLGIAESIADEVEIDEYAAKFQKRFFYNDATPPLLFHMPEATDEQLKAFMASWNKRHKGVENSHKAAAVAGSIDVKLLGSNDTRNLGFIDSRVSMRDAVLEHFSVPREIMGITENSNRATADAAQYIYAKNVLMPRITNREEAINKQLLPMFGPNLVWRYDSIVPYDQDFNKAKALEGWAAGLLTKNEARGLLDMPDIEGGDVFKVSINDLFIGKDDDPVQITHSMLEADTQVVASLPAAKGQRRVNVTAMLKQEDAALRKNSRAFEAAALRHFAGQKKQLEKALGLTEKDEKDDLFSLMDEYLLPDGTFNPELWATLSEAAQLAITVKVADGLLDWKAEANKLMELFMPLWKASYYDATEIAGGGYDIATIRRPEFRSAAQVNGGQRVVGIEETTKNDIASVIARGVSKGEAQTTIKKRILKVMDTTDARAKLIARQETATALATGQFDMMKAAGATTKTWHHRPQKNPRDGSHGQPDHVSLEGETVGIDEKFSNGLRYPRDPEDDRPEELINCRCYVTYGGF